MAGRIDFTFAPIGTAAPLIQAGKISALAVSTKARARALPDVPTTIEAGFPNSEFDFWIGLFMIFFVVFARGGVLGVFARLTRRSRKPS